MDGDWHDFYGYLSGGIGMGRVMNLAEQLVGTVRKFEAATIADPHGRFRSWEHCYVNFGEARKCDEPDIDNLSLHLAFYLASWGMYRGSSFLLQKDYKVHAPVVKEILKPEYDALYGIECKEYLKPENLDLLDKLTDFIARYYDEVRKETHECKSDLSKTLITKVLMGTMGCVPAYDQFFVKMIREHGVARGIYNRRSVVELTRFYLENEEVLEALRAEIGRGRGVKYPQMKILDMGFWQMGVER